MKGDLSSTFLKISAWSLDFEAAAVFLLFYFSVVSFSPSPEIALYTPYPILVAKAFYLPIFYLGVIESFSYNLLFLFFSIVFKILM